MNILRAITAFALLFSLAVSSCGEGSNSTGNNSGSGSTANGSGAPKTLMGAGEAKLDFEKVNVGLPSTALDYVGEQPLALCGAREAGIVFYSIQDEERTLIYSANLDTAEKKFVLEIADYVPGSMTCSADGTALCYNRGRAHDRMYDDGFYGFPPIVAVPYYYDVETGEETMMFDFRDEELAPYRTQQITFYLSSDGSRAAAVSINMDTHNAYRQLLDWAVMYEDYKQNYDNSTINDNEQKEDILRMLTNSKVIAGMLREDGITPSKVGRFPDEEAEAVKALSNELAKLDSLALIWEGGEGSYVEITPAEGMQIAPHYVSAMTNDQVFIGAREPSPVLVESFFYLLNEKDGSLQTVGNIVGPSSVVELNSKNDALLVIYNPFDEETAEIEAESVLKTIPLDGSEATETSIGGDYLGYADIIENGERLVAQSADDNYLYRVEIPSGEESLLCKVSNEISGLFAKGDGNSFAYFENGVIFSMALPENPQSDTEWVDDSYFADYKQRSREFLEQLGYVLPPELAYRIQKREGLGLSEVSMQAINPQDVLNPVLLRFDINKYMVTRFWVPHEHPFEFSTPGTDGDIDGYEAEEICSATLDKFGWLNAETRETYLIDGNYQLDNRSNSYVITFMDGYEMQNGNDTLWVYNTEATMRIGRSSGRVEEMTYHTVEPEMEQAISYPLEQVPAVVRTKGPQAFPGSSPVRIDTENIDYRVVEDSQFKVEDGIYTRVSDSRLCYQVESYLTPEEQLLFITLVDTESGDHRGQMNFLPEAMLAEIATGNQATEEMPFMPPQAGQSGQ